MTFAVRLGDVLLDLNRLLYYKGGHYISKRELVASLETLAFHESPHFGFSESFPQKPKPRATLFTSEAAMDTQNVQQEAAESDVVTFMRRGGISILEAIAVKLPDVFAAEILPKLDDAGYAQLGAGEQGVQRRGVERGRRSVVGSEDQGTLC